MSDNCPAAGPRLVRTLRRRLAAHRGEQGLALLDVLLGAALFSLIALIAVQAIGHFRLRAYESGAVSDARQVGTALEAGFADTASYPALSESASELPEVNLTDGIAVRGYTTDGTNVRFCAAHESGAWATWSSADGGIDGHGRKDAPAECGDGSDGGGSASGACKIYASTWIDDYGVLHVNGNVYGVEDGWAVECPSASNADLAAFLGGFAGANATYNDHMAEASLPGVSEADFETALAAWMAEKYPEFTRDDGTSDDCDPTLGPC